jgi:hypothetical protein
MFENIIGSNAIHFLFLQKLKKLIPHNQQLFKNLTTLVLQSTGYRRADCGCELLIYFNELLGP